MRADPGPPPAVVMVAASLLGTVVAYLDLFGAHLAQWGAASLFAYLSVVAFLVPTLVVLRGRWRRWLAHAPSSRWPDAVIAAAATGLTCSVAAHLIGEGDVLGLLVAVLASAALAVTAARIRT